MGHASRLGVVGDTHADLTRAVAVADAAKAAGCSRLLQVGDFGWFPHLPEERRFLEQLDARCAEIGVEWAFVGGNHDDWVELDRLALDGERDADGLVVVGEALRYVPRPHRWVWHGVRFGALGGAWSIDHRARVAFVDWWPNEQPTFEHAQELVAGGALDVLVTHDAPGEVDLSPAAWSGDDSGGGFATRALIDMVVHGTRPRLLLHGHWHWRHTTRLASGCRVEGLGDNHGRPQDQYAVVDLADPALSCGAAPPLEIRAPHWQP